MIDVQTKETAPTGSREALAEVEKTLGFIPNLYGVFAGSPATLKAYLGISEAYANSDLTPAEQQLVLIATSVENGCEYCVAAHSTISNGGKLFAPGVLDALRDDRPLQDTRLEALRRFTLEVVRERGHLSESAVEEFLGAGFTQAHVLSVLTGVAMKTFSNYTNHIAKTPLDPAFRSFEWRTPAAV